MTGRAADAASLGIPVNVYSIYDGARLASSSTAAQWIVIDAS